MISGYTCEMDGVGRVRGLTFPAMTPYHSQPALHAIAVEGVRREDQVQQHIVEECLKSRDRCPFVLQEGGEGAGGGVGDRQHLSGREG